ncbi:AlpA family transcriptional regulator [Parafrankia sp. EUN1f]|uniref:helix-turn-helix transcriptional regulator n=1 Tax=Parafrankia sp. EUN1f TaxID=102897 RepID=UPI0001C45696|nr:helix-turn-helix domain-containing protein [Parafrankia sp. EUN1f]EFC78887.1 regulatory protein MerR [Parafrankia sp. EUN1f]
MTEQLRSEKVADLPTGRKRLWTVDDLAAFLGVPVTTVYKWRNEGEGPPGYRIGRYLRFDEQGSSRGWRLVAAFRVKTDFR